MNTKEKHVGASWNWKAPTFEKASAPEDAPNYHAETELRAHADKLEEALLRALDIITGDQAAEIGAYDALSAYHLSK